MSHFYQNNMLPEAFQSIVYNLYPDQAEQVLATFKGKPRYGIRVNLFKTSTGHIQTILEQAGIHTLPVAWYRHALVVAQESTPELADILTQLPDYQNGLFTIQNCSSMIPPLVLDPQPGESILDLTAAPGSKTGMIAECMENTGTILANDTSRTRLYKLRDTLSRLGVTNVETSNMLGERLWEKHQNWFHRVLADVPCSMEGMFNLLEPASYEHWSPRKVKKLAKQQRWLLRSAISAAKPGGTVVYSTCTLSPEENEGVISWFLERYGHTAQLESISPATFPGIHAVSGISNWNRKTYHSDVSKTLRILPDGVMEGFFVAKLVKRG
jgi:NOL1/NOP2/sun family putative RNA methylase